MLDQQALASALADIFDAMPGSPAEAALAMADAYRDYTAAASFGPSLPVILDEMRDAMSEVLLVAIEAPLLGAPATFAGAWSAAVATFWLGVAVVGPQVGATAGCPGAASLTGSLSAVFANLANTSEMCANGMATALHAATMTVTAAVSPPPGTVLPIA